MFDRGRMFDLRKRLVVSFCRVFDLGKRKSLHGRMYTSVLCVLIISVGVSLEQCLQCT